MVDTVAVEGRRPRIPAIDALRGIAIAAMVVYHFSWDLSAFGLYAVDVIADPRWKAFARTIAGTFIFLVGVSLVLATRDGFRPRHFYRRLAIIVGAAMLVTLGTVYWFPDAFVFFGILHLIAFASVAALPFLRLPLPLVAAVAAAIFVLPFVFTHPVFDEPLLWWVGLTPRPPTTVDYVPVFPWFGVALFGIVAGRLLLAYGLDSRFARWMPKNRAGRLAIWAGRWSLPIYLVHQPILIGLLTVVTPFVQADSTTPEEFMSSCTTECRTGGNDAAMCESVCDCVRAGLPGLGLPLSANTSRLDAVERDRWIGLVRQCVASTEPPAASDIPIPLPDAASPPPATPPSP